MADAWSCLTVSLLRSGALSYSNLHSTYSLRICSDPGAIRAVLRYDLRQSMRFAVTLADLALAQQSGCDSKPTPTLVAKAAPAKPPLHRFILPRFPADDGVAFDTQTGQICKTWGWEPVGKASAPDPATGNSPQRIVGEFAPTCLSIYERYPSGPGDSVVAEDQQPDQK
jgi:hypothetical protein